MGKEVESHEIDHKTFELTIIYKDGSQAKAKVKNFSGKLLDENFLKALYGKAKGKAKEKELQKTFDPLKQFLKDNPMPIQ